jgi:hypothetical protein
MPSPPNEAARGIKVVLPYPILWDLSSAHSNHYDSLTIVLEGLERLKTDWHTLDECTVDY